MLKSTICTQPVTLEQIYSICTSLVGTVDALADRNSLALIVRNTGEITFTKQGSKVISESSHHHPIEKLVIHACNRYSEKTGDDCKMFLLLLKEIMYGIVSLLKKYDEMYVRKQLSSEIASLISFLPGPIGNIRNTFGVVSDQHLYLKSFSTDLEGIVETFFESKFPLSVSKHLCTFFCEFLLGSICDRLEIDTLQYLLLHFDLFCSKAYLPLSESSIISGILLHHQFIGKNSSDLQFIVVWNLKQKFDNASWNIETDSFPKQLDLFWLTIEESLNALQTQGISLILSPSSACQNMKCLCFKKNIILIDCLSEEDINNILFFTSISPLNNLNEMLSRKNVAYLNYIGSVTFGNFHYTHLQPLNSRCSTVSEQTAEKVKKFVPNHIVLCALTDDLWKEYYSSLHDCLKVIRQWLNPSLLSTFNDIQDDQLNVLEENTNMQELLQTYRGFFKKSEIFSRKLINNPCASNSIAIGLSIPLGLWEFLFKITLENILDKNQLVFPSFCPLLRNALLKIISKTWNVSLLNFKGLKSFFKFYVKVKHKLNTPIEPILSKEDQMFQVLQLLQQLLKIDAIIGTK